MPYKRKRAGAYIGGRPYKRRAVRKSRAPLRRGRKKFGLRIPDHKFHRWLTAFNSGVGTSFVNVSNCTYDGTDSFITCTASAKTCGLSLAFQLLDLPGLTDFSALFDTYKITGVMLQFKLMDNPDSSGNINDVGGFQKNNFFPTIWYVQDDDDNNNMTLPQIKEFERVKHRVLYPNRETNIMLRPSVLQQLYRSSTTTGYGTGKRNQWLDMAQTDIPHYGFKCVIDFEGLTPAGTFKIKVNAKYYFSCKSVR